jgi:hypothetical protein
MKELLDELISHYHARPNTPDARKTYTRSILSLLPTACPLYPPLNKSPRDPPALLTIQVRIMPCCHAISSHLNHQTFNTAKAPKNTCFQLLLLTTTSETSHAPPEIILTHIMTSASSATTLATPLPLHLERPPQLTTHLFLRATSRSLQHQYHTPPTMRFHRRTRPRRDDDDSTPAPECCLRCLLDTWRARVRCCELKEWVRMCVVHVSRSGG